MTVAQLCMFKKTKKCISRTKRALFLEPQLIFENS